MAAWLEKIQRRGMNAARSCSPLFSLSLVDHHPSLAQPGPTSSLGLLAAGALPQHPSDQLPSAFACAAVKSARFFFSLHEPATSQRHTKALRSARGQPRHAVRLAALSFLYFRALYFILLQFLDSISILIQKRMNKLNRMVGGDRMRIKEKQ
jgi:hypothetical protein